MSQAQNDTPAAPAAAPSMSDALDQAMAEVEKGAPAAEAKPVDPPKIEEKPDAEAKPDGEKPKAKRDSSSDPIAKAIRATREAERTKKEADRILAEASELGDSIKAKDYAKLQDVLERSGITFADLVKFNLESDGTKTPEQQLAAQVGELKAKLDEREKADKDRETTAERERYEANERDALAAVDRLAKGKGDEFKLCQQVAADADLREHFRINPYHDALVEVDAAWLAAGKPKLSQEEFDECVAAGLTVVEGRLQKIKAKLAPPPSEPAKQTEPETREPTSASPNTITSTIGSRGVTPLAPTRTRPPTRDEAIEEALREAGAA